jgi:hypothetical protein
MEPFSIRALRALPISEEFLKRATAGGRGEKCILNLQSVAEVLASLNDPLGDAFRRHSRLRSLVGVRNEMAHGIRAVTPAQAREMIDSTTKLLFEHSALAQPVPRPSLNL